MSVVYFLVEVVMAVNQIPVTIKGAELLKEAERISREEYNAGKIAIISGVGVRNYFSSEFGYKLEGAYMVKDLT